jgi:hypothetical protein
MGNLLTSIKPHQVSRNLKGYSVMFYGTPKSGKTTTACKFPNHLLLAFEKGYSTIPGAMALPINSWTEFRSAIVDLKDEETKQMYDTVIMDTADIAYMYCEKYICNREGKATIGDIPYGAGYGMVETEFDDCLRKIIQLGYGLVLISHSTDRTEKDTDGSEYLKMMPTLDKRGRKVCERTCDIIGLSQPVKNAQGEIETRLFLRETPRFVAGSRFKYMPDSIVFTYDNLVNAIAEAVDLEAKEHGNQYVTDKFVNLHADNAIETTADYEELMAEFQVLVGKAMEKSQSNRARITSIVNEYLGFGKKVSECTEVNTPQLLLIVAELRKLVTE